MKLFEEERTVLSHTLKRVVHKEDTFGLMGGKVEEEGKEGESEEDVLLGG